MEKRETAKSNCCFPLWHYSMPLHPAIPRQVAPQQSLCPFHRATVSRLNDLLFCNYFRVPMPGTRAAIF